MVKTVTLSEGEYYPAEIAEDTQFDFGYVSICTIIFVSRGEFTAAVHMLGTGFKPDLLKSIINRVKEKSEDDGKYIFKVYFSLGETRGGVPVDLPKLEAGSDLENFYNAVKYCIKTNGIALREREIRSYIYDSKRENWNPRYNGNGDPENPPTDLRIITFPG